MRGTYELSLGPSTGSYTPTWRGTSDVSLGLLRPYPYPRVSLRGATPDRAESLSLALRATNYQQLRLGQWLALLTRQTLTSEVLRCPAL